MVFGVGAIFPAQIREALGDLAEGIVTTEINLNPDDQNAPAIDTLRTEMKAIDSAAEVTTIGLFGWAGAYIIAAAAQNISGDVTPASLTEAIAALQDLDMLGILGPFTATGVNNPLFPRFMNPYGVNYVITDGVPVRQGEGFYDLRPALEAGN
jgi:hypothetical protein